MKGQRETAIGRAEGRSGACPCTSLGFEGAGDPSTAVSQMGRSRRSWDGMAVIRPV